MPPPRRSDSAGSGGDAKRGRPAQSQSPVAPQPWNILHTLLLAIGAGCVLCCGSSIYLLHATATEGAQHHQQLHAPALAKKAFSVQHHQQKQKQPQKPKQQENPQPQPQKPPKEPPRKEPPPAAAATGAAASPLAGLDCARFPGGPAEAAAAAEMVYWRDVPADQRFQSPFRRHRGQRQSAEAAPRQYMTFEPDGGGWNNIRMAMETVLGLAIATGRTVVLPPAQRMYLLAKDREKHKIEFTFADFFPMHELAAEHEGLEIITMKQFLETTAGTLRNKFTGQIEYPPNNWTDWDGQDFTVLKEWLRNVTVTPHWSPGRCLAAIPAAGGAADVTDLQAMAAQLAAHKQPVPEYTDDPVPVDAAPLERLRENAAGRTQLCIYDQEMQAAPVVHFMCSHKLGVRMLVHFYAFLFFEDWREDLWMKRFMRDHVRYSDEIQCAAARLVQAMRQYALSKTGNSSAFDTFHIRRGDFQFKRTRIEAAQIYDNVKDVLEDGAIVYIATDERDKKFFDPLREHYDIKFMADFKPLLEGVNTNYFGMIDQLVASRGRRFFGCWHSTFTGFINRMRAYHASKQKLPGHEKGVLPESYYYVPKEARDAMHKYAVLHGAFFNREFPVSWKDIDKGIDELAVKAQS